MIAVILVLGINAAAIAYCLGLARWQRARNAKARLSEKHRREAA